MKSPKFLTIMSLLMTAVMSGCSSSGGPFGLDPSIEVTDISVLPPPSDNDFVSDVSVDVVRPFDVLSVWVFGIEELSREGVRVGSNGAFDYPLIGSVQANGRTLDDITRDMENRLGESYVRDPEIRVDFVSRDAQVFTLSGEVTRPGQYPLLQPTTLMDAVALGSGRTDYANFEEVFIFREVNGLRYIGIYDLSAIQRGNYPDPRIFPQDIVIVGENAATRRFANIAPLVPLVTSPLVVLERILQR